MKTLRLFVLTLTLLVFTPIVYAQDYDFYLQKARQRIAEGDCEGAQRSYNVYKDLSKKTNNEIERQIENCQGGSKHSGAEIKYVDLGLPSGTLWCETTENGLYTQNEAIKKFGNSMPIVSELRELYEKCEWTIVGNQYKVTGPNGNFILLSANGCGDSYSGYRVGEYGCYWSSTITGQNYNNENGLGFYISEKYYFMWNYEPESTMSVRLVKRNQNVTPSKNNGILLYSQIPEIYCDGIYDNHEPRYKNGHAFHTSNLNINRDHFRIHFSFKVCEDLFVMFRGTESEYVSAAEVVIAFSDCRRLIVYLHEDGTIHISTNNHKNTYYTNVPYPVDKYMTIDLEYDYGVLYFNGKKMDIEMDTSEQDYCDKAFHSLDYASGDAFHGYIKDVKIYSYPD